MIDAYVRRFPRDLEGWTLQARVAGATGDPRKAAEAYLRQIELSPRKLS